MVEKQETMTTQMTDDEEKYQSKTMITLGTN